MDFRRNIINFSGLNSLYSSFQVKETPFLNRDQEVSFQTIINQQGLHPILISPNTMIQET